MVIYDFKNAFFIGFFMAFMIGPVFFVLIKTSILKGARAAIVFDFGVILGDITFMLIAYFGSRNLLEKIKDDPRLFIVGGLVLIIYGFISYLDKNNKNGWVNIDLKKSQGGKFYGELNTWQPNSDGMVVNPAPTQENTNDDLPF